MMLIQSEQEIIKSAIEVLINLGYKEINIPIESLSNNLILSEVLEDQIQKINSYEYNGQRCQFSKENVKKAVEDINIELTSGLISTNEKIYDLLTIGKSYQETMIDGSKRFYDIKYIDFCNPENNVFNIVQQFSVKGTNEKYMRFDIVLFINGIPIAIIECKSPEEKLEQGISQMIMSQKVEQLFKFIQIIMVTNSEDCKYATCGTALPLWSTWNEQENNWVNTKLAQVAQNRKITFQDRAIVSLFSPERILDIIKNYIIFENGKKKICRYQQYFTVKSILKRINEFDSRGKRKGGVVWHTQGSGKSMTMAYTVKQILEQVNSKDAKVVLVTDRVDLDSQIHKIFNKIGIQAIRASTGQNLVQLIQNENVKIITTVINKFEAAIKSDLSIESKNIFILIDEAHRTQYGEINRKMQNVFKNATYISFTGTPLMQKDKDTFKKFGDLIMPTYTINKAIEDKVIVPLIYESKIPQLPIENINKINPIYDEMAYNSCERIHAIALNINEHYMKNFKGTGFNAMLACGSISQAINYYKELKNIGDLEVAIIVSLLDKDEDEIHQIKDERKNNLENFYSNLVKEYKNVKDYEDITKYKFIKGDIDILIVVDKLLTGFDAPKASVLYIDKSLKGHNLLQAIARVNRVYEGKDYGYIIDYRGLLGELNKALTMYNEVDLDHFSEEDLKQTIYYIDLKIQKLQESYKKLLDIFKYINNKQNIEEYEILLENKEIRNNFYDEFYQFASLFNIILSSKNGTDKVGKEIIEKYKKALKFYQNLRKEIKIRYSDDIDHKEYEIKLQKMLDTHINAKGELKIEELADITDKVKLEKEYQIMTTSRAKADLIRTRIVKTINEKNEKSQYYDKFIKRIEEIMEKYTNKDISDDEYLKEILKLKEEFILGDAKGTYPKNIKSEEEKAIYGVIYNIIQSKLNQNCTIEEIGKIAINIKESIQKRIKRDWKSNEEVQNSIKMFIDEEIYIYIKEKNIELSFDEIDIIIEAILKVAMRIYKE